MTKCGEDLTHPNNIQFQKLQCSEIKEQLLKQMHLRQRKLNLPYHTILGKKRISISIERNEPIPFRRQSKQNRCPVKREGKWRRPFWVGKIGLPHNIHVLRRFENGVTLHGDGETLPFCLRRRRIQVEEVVVPGMVRGKEQPEDPTPITM